MTPDEFQLMMCQAARQRRRVELADGRIAELVYWPGRKAHQRERVKPLRHGDPLAAGVRFDVADKSRVHAVDPLDVIGFAP